MEILKTLLPSLTEECVPRGEHPAVLLLLRTADPGQPLDGLLGVLPHSTEGRDATEPLPARQVPAVPVSVSTPGVHAVEIFLSSLFLHSMIYVTCNVYKSCIYKGNCTLRGKFYIFMNGSLDELNFLP